VSAVRASHGVISLPSLDVRTRPDHRAELGSQLLLGEIVERLGASRDGAWLRIRNRADGYRGWARAWGVVPASAARVRRWERRASARVMVPHALLRARPGAGLVVSPLFAGGRAIPLATRGRHRLLELPDGRRGWVEARSILTRRPRPRPLQARIGSLLGVPYLWGGRTPLGLDCSAFTQIVLGEGGVRLPRDAADQARACRRLGAGEPAKPGDLVFFGRPRARIGHVGIGLGGDLFAHARGYVRLGSLNSSNPLCDKALVAQFRCWGRPPDRETS
jgi:gamma-D-glutamyl-L-lysine dipeptidyl-peptidase